MIFTNKLLPVALIAALIGGSVGALVMHSRSGQTASAEEAVKANDQTQNADLQTAEMLPADLKTAGEETAYKVGFADGFQAALETSQSRTASSAQSRVVSRNVGTRTSTRRAYYDYSKPQGRSFWQKHRDKLTLAIGTGAGAAVGGLVGGKKGAAIGALSGAGGSALYTYKLRKRNQSY